MSVLLEVNVFSSTAACPHSIVTTVTLETIDMCKGYIVWRHWPRATCSWATSDGLTAVEGGLNYRQGTRERSRCIKSQLAKQSSATVHRLLSHTDITLFRPFS